ncbi:TetR family transcriptional regulator [Geobacter sp. FeAm09]|uniref:TetR family transcriptional regulator n=1 Tax=Geobacter sp. FeAm09 TaxID=2597769 RepID=UPI00143D0E6B|nr:TetR family transcriptional regulator [Geobacter sp. FeAm09]
MLKTAERLLAEHEYGGVDMRVLADEASVNLDATAHHFGSKGKPYIEAIMCRFRPISEERIWDQRL